MSNRVKNPKLSEIWIVGAMVAIPFAALANFARIRTSAIAVVPAALRASVIFLAPTIGDLIPFLHIPSFALRQKIFPASVAPDQSEKFRIRA
jgi:hypothetical protein